MNIDWTLVLILAAVAIPCLTLILLMPIMVIGGFIGAIKDNTQSENDNAPV